MWWGEGQIFFVFLYRKEWLRKMCLREFGNEESELDNLIRLKRIRFIHKSSGCV